MTQPNCVVVVADDMGYGDLGLFNDGRCATPNLDRMASEGLCLTQHYSGSPVCAPSRRPADGQVPSPHGGDRHPAGKGSGPDRPRADDSCGCLQAGWLPYGPAWQMAQRGPRPPFPSERPWLRRVRGLLRGLLRLLRVLPRLQRLGAPRRRAVSDRRAQRAGDRLHTSAPGRALPSRPRIQRSSLPDAGARAGRAAIPRAGRNARSRSLTYTMIELMDAGIRRLDEALTELGLSENTIFLFTSDNGPYLGEVAGVSLERFGFGLRRRSTTSSKAASAYRRSCAGQHGSQVVAGCTRWCTSPTGSPRSPVRPASACHTSSASTGTTRARSSKAQRIVTTRDGSGRTIATPPASKAMRR